MDDLVVVVVVPSVIWFCALSPLAASALISTCSCKSLVNAVSALRQEVEHKLGVLQREFVARQREKAPGVMAANKVQRLTMRWIGCLGD